MFIALSSYYIVAAMVVLLMLVAAFVRNHKLIAGLSFAGLLLALITVLNHCGCPFPQWAENLMTTDKITWLFLAMTLVGGMFINIFSYFYFEKFEEQKEEYYVLLNTAILGTMVMVSASHFVSFFIGLELLSIPLYVMVAYLRERPGATEAGIKYLTLAGASSAALLFGFALMYAGTGTMTLVGFAEVMQSNHVVQPFIYVGIALFIVSIGFKLALAPFHMWAADVYQGSPAPVTAFLASIAKAGAMVFLLRFFMYSLLNLNPAIYLLLGILAALSMFVGNLLALNQPNVKRMLAFSSIAHMGYLLIVVVSGSESSINTAIFYLASYFITTIAVFSVIAVISDKEEIEKTEQFKGLYYRNPFLAIVFAAGILSLAGMPLTAGFISKILVAFTGAGTGNWWLVWLLVINSAIGLYYYIKVVTVLFKKEESTEQSKIALPILSSIALAVLLLTLIYLGVAPGGLLNLM